MERLIEAGPRLRSAKDSAASAAAWLVAASAAEPRPPR